MNLEIPKKYRAYLRVGTCSWKYDSWKGLLYDDDTKYHRDDYLVDYSKHLDTVEVDQWFWSLFPTGVKLPEPKTVETYASSVPSVFVFSIKAPNAITLTHFYAKQPARHKEFANLPNDGFLSVELLEQFLETLEPLKSRLGPIMFQFEYLNKKKMPTRDAFLEQLGAFFDKAPKGYKYAVESRNPNYLTKPYFDFLRGRKLAHVFLDGYYMPPIGEVAGKNDTQTADFSVVRLHGPNRKEIEAQTNSIWNRVVAPQDAGILSAVDIVKRNTEKLITTYINVNNHYEGSAPLTIDRFVDALKKVG
jgi:uncharacterized protein YecE (DUF72 family)